MSGPQAPAAAPAERLTRVGEAGGPDYGAPDVGNGPGGGVVDAGRPAGAAVLVGPDVPRDTTPTFELEMLVSGAVLFGLFQVPPAVKAAWAERVPHLTPVGVGVGGPAVMLVLVVLYALTGCFVVHLALRAYWVALVGAHSVFPGGVRWDKAREYGPFQSRLNQTRVRPLPEFIARVDNAASLVSASGFVLGAGVLAVAATFGAILLFAWAATELLGPRRGLLVAAAVYFPVMIMLSVAPLVDMKFGERIDPDSRLGRILGRLIWVGQGVLPAGVRSLMSVLSSNVPKRVVWAASVVGFAGAMSLAVSDVLPSDPSLPGEANYRFFNGTVAGAALPSLGYASIRGPWDASLRGPSVDS